MILRTKTPSQIGPERQMTSQAAKQMKNTSSNLTAVLPKIAPRQRARFQAQETKKVTGEG